MNAQIDSARSHPAIHAALVIGGIAFASGALLVIAYMLDWLPSKPQLPSTPTSMANPGQQVAGSAPDVALLPGETLVAPADAPAARETTKPVAPATAQRPAPQYATPASPPTLAPRKPTTPASAPPAYAQALPSRAAPGKPNYTSDEVARNTAYGRSTRDVCVNCGAVLSIAPMGPEWEVRVRFDDGSGETLRYPERPSFRIGDRVHLEEGRLLPD
jgi:hypothetical protein